MAGDIEALKFLPVRLGITRLSVEWRFILCALIMIIYMIISREIYNSRNITFAEVEAFRTPLRLLAALFFWLLMADVIFERDVQAKPLVSSPLIVGISIMLASPILTGRYDVPISEATTIGLASIPVGLSEELFYRGIIQTLFTKHMGVAQGILASALLFTLFHIGVLESGYLNVFLGGLILGLVYWKTGSLAGAIVIHAIYDMLLALPINPLLPDIAASGLLLVATCLIFIWARRAT